MLENIKLVLTRERIICRIIAAWCSFAAFMLYVTEGNFFELSFLQDTSLASMFIYIALIFVIYTIFSSLLTSYEADSWFLLGAATLCVTKWIVDYNGAKNSFLFVLGVIAAYLLFLLYALNKNTDILSRFNFDNNLLIIFITALGLFSATMIALITCLRYRTFSAPNYDFGLFCNMFHYMKETGLPLVTSERDALLSHFAVHVSPIYYVILPFYIIFPSPMTIQIAQAVVVASGIAPVALLAKKYSLSNKTTFVVSLIYALYPALSTGCFYDIHENCFLAPLLLWTFYFFEKEKYIPMYIFALGVLFVKEDAAVYLMVFAIYLLLSRKKYMHGTIIAAGSLAYFLFALWYLKEFGTGVMVNRFDNLIFNHEDGLFGAIKTTLFNPGYLLTQLFTTSGNGWEKIGYFLQMLLPLGMLPFCTKKASRWLLLSPMLLNLLTYYIYQYDIGFQYQFAISAFLIYATVQNLPELELPTRRNLLSIGAASCLCIYLLMVVPKAEYYTKVWDEGKDTYIRMEEILDTLPEDASLNVGTFLLPHVADREYVYEIGYHGNKTDVDYVVFDLRYGMSGEDTRSMNSYLQNGYEIYEEHKGLILILKKTA